MLKIDNFFKINDKKYHQVWKMNQKKADDLIQNINNIDKIIHEEILELEWTPPNTDLLKQCDLPSYKNAIYTPGKFYMISLPPLIFTSNVRLRLFRFSSQTPYIFSISSTHLPNCSYD